MTTEEMFAVGDRVEGGDTSEDYDTGRVVAILGDGVVEHGYRVSIVTEGEAGHRPTGDWPYLGKLGQKLPWFWGPSLEEAKEQCAQYNERMGVSRDDALAIVTASIAKQLRSKNKKRARKTR